MTVEEKKEMEQDIIHNKNLSDEKWLEYGERVKDLPDDERQAFHRTLAGRILAQVLSMKRFRR